MKMKIERRTFLKRSSLLALSTPLLSIPFTNTTAAISKHLDDQLEIHIFSKHLQFLDYKGMAEFAADIGFAGLDITVRPKGHVLPENVKRDLPKAVEAVKKAGLKTVTITTAITQAEEKYAEDILQTMADQNIRYYRMGWLRYPEDITIPKAMSAFKKQMEALTKLNKKYGIVGAYQNHSGRYVGASIWEVWELLEKVDTTVMGAQYDIRHATVEGGKSWQTGLRLIEPYIKTIVLKDFRWEKNEKGWNAINTPIGEGMVNFKEYFSLLKKYNIKVPISLHMEHDLGGAEHGKKEITMSKDKIYEVMKKDLTNIQALWKSA
ncbi:MAG: sugar phosphate isomerase/epimerase family protein [Bacteroidota bacterium]